MSRRGKAVAGCKAGGKLRYLLAALLIATVVPAGCGGGEAPSADRPPVDSQFAVTRPTNRLIYIRDPYIYANPDFGVYYLTGTVKNPVAKDGKGFVVYKSKDLENWAGPFSVFNGDVLDGDYADFWAPEIHKLGKYYYLFGTFGPNGGHRRTQILRSETIEEEFAVWGDATPPGTGCLDATLYEEDGKLYSVYAEEWVTRRDKVGLMCVAELRPDLRDILPETRRVLFKATDSPLQAPWEGNITDGPQFFRNRHGELIMLWSTFTDRYGGSRYIETYAVSDNGSITGNFIQAEEPLYAEDGGHGMIFKDFEGNLKFVFHTPNSAPEHIEIRDVDDSQPGIVKLK